MPDLKPAIDATIGNPLVVAVFLLVLGMVSGRFLFKGHPIGRALTRLFFFILLTLVLLRGDVVPYQPLRPAATVFQGIVSAGLRIAWWLWAAWLLVGFLRSFLIFERRPRDAKLLQDIIAGIIYLAAFFAIIAYVFDLPIQGLLATSGAIAIILGLALQSSLGDVFSGLVLSFSRPYRPDDWVRFDGGAEGRVIEMNWHATHLLTSEQDLAIVPNSMIVKARIVNLSAPSDIHGMTVSVALMAEAPPATGIPIIEHAILNSRRILSMPKPWITIKSVYADVIVYGVTFFIADLSSSTAAQNELLDLLYRHLAAAGLSLAVSPDGTAPIRPPAPATEEERVLAQSAIFATLPDAERGVLAKKLQRKLHDPGNVLAQPGAPLQSLFLVGSGVLSVTRPQDGRQVEILRLGPGDHFGEIGLLTGAPVMGFITALAPAAVYELAKKDLTPTLEANPQITQELCRALTQRQAAGRTIVSTVEHGTTESEASVSRWFAERFQRLFDPDE
jgi:small-conductance mechanosensitive channel/CRP-like cAMP-binding protein